MTGLYVNVTPHQYHALWTEREKAERTGLYGTLIRWLCAMAAANGGNFITPAQFFPGIEVDIRVMKPGEYE
jgi:hypothetical protein